jgi:arsenite oxidase small subunit
MSEHDLTPPQTEESCSVTDTGFHVSRRQFLFGTGAAITLLSMPGWMRGRGMPAKVYAQTAEFERKRIASVSELETGDTVAFNYPWDHPNAANFLIKLGKPAGGGVGPDSDIVAFNSFCTHQGGPLAGKFQADPGVAGPCPLHWTTFDLTRYGMVVSGHAALGLPQITLEVDGDDIYATGVMGLIFGYYDNSVDPTA